jgi:hypothetical protein
LKVDTAVASRFSLLDIKGIPAARRDTVKAAVLAGALHLSEDYEAWIVPARRPPGYAVRIIGPRGFYREAKFAGHETESEITASIRQTLQVSASASAGGH